MYVTDEEALAAQEVQSAGASKPRGLDLTARRRSSSHALPPSQVLEASFTSAAAPSYMPGFPGHAPVDLSLLKSVVPPQPSEFELDELCSAPPLSYNEARVAPSDHLAPVRSFCEICGYWGQVKCLNCGARVCGLSCKTAHDEDRCQKYMG